MKRYDYRRSEKALVNIEELDDVLLKVSDLDAITSKDFTPEELNFEVFECGNFKEVIAYCKDRADAEKIVDGLNERELRRAFVRSLLPA